ncbi:Lysophospholipase L1 [Evansella caseinilytica]|uniref:Lysophospholipase L1 n=1 Tax=Evansella caseinilytica TaxID=1503961 RepID=A0A1H3GK79_9BACI|nr:rhamnogalacturonan acetylesterase [Evansella caseinilytica]SDY03507.1 Lysophospholipase L1 [Evansella caseinilytica]
MCGKVNVYLAGDSTVQTYDKSDAPQSGWGKWLATFFPCNVTVLNHAIGGRSSKTFITEGRLAAIVEQIRENDYLFVQIGHNDATKNKPERYTEPFTTYKNYLKMYIDGARSRKAIPVLLTPVARLHYENGTFVNDFPEYCRAMKEVAAEKDVLLIDLMARSLEEYASAGYEAVRSYFMISVNGADCTHFTETGAKVIARLVAEGIRDLNIELSSCVRMKK